MIGAIGRVLFIDFLKAEISNIANIHEITQISKITFIMRASGLDEIALSAGDSLEWLDLHPKIGRLTLSSTSRASHLQHGCRSRDTEDLN